MGVNCGLRGCWICRGDFCHYSGKGVEQGPVEGVFTRCFTRCVARLQMQRSFECAEQGCKCKGHSNVRSKVANAKVLRKVLRKDASSSDLLKNLP
jgi:hypothetical protein